MLRQIGIFGFCVAGMGLIFSYYASWRADADYNFLNYALGNLIMAIVASVGFSLGHKISKDHLKTQHLFLAALVTLLLSNSIHNILNTAEMPWIVNMLVVFGVALLLSWRMPVIFNKSAANK